LLWVGGGLQYFAAGNGEWLRERKLETLQQTGAIAVAAGNIGCISQLDSGDLPVRHTVQFIDWASGGPSPL